MTNRGFVGHALAIQTALSNDMFSTVQPSPAEVRPLILEMQSLLTQTDLGYTMLRGKRDQVRATITDMLYRQSMSVNLLANGDMNVLCQCGFDISKEPERMPEPTKGFIPKLLRQADEVVWLTCDGIEYQNFYEVEVAGPDGFIKSYISKKKKMMLEDLPVDVVLNAHVRGVNSRGNGPWTGSINFIVYGNIQDKIHPKKISE